MLQFSRFLPPPLSRQNLALTLMLIGWISALVALVQPVAAAPIATPLPISPAGKDAAAPAIVVSAAGAIHVAWEQEGGIWCRSQRNGVWSDAVQVASEGEHPTLAAAPDEETLYLAWSQEFGGNYEVFSRRWDAVDGWSAPKNVSSNDGGSSSPALAVSADGHVHLIWADTSPGVSTLYHAVSSDGLSWPVALPIADALGGNPAVVFADDGEMVVAWQYRASFADNLRIWTARYRNGAWTTPVALTDGSQHALAPNLSANARRLALVWQEGDRVKLAFWSNNAWQVAVTQPGLRPAVAITDAGLVQWDWETDNGLASQFGLAGWTSPAYWAQNSARSGDLALAAHGQVISAVWMENQNGNNRIFHNSNAFATINLPLLRRH